MHGTIYLGLLRETEQPDLNRLADLIKLVAALPPSGAVVLVSSPRERAEISDLILQHRGTAVLDATKVSIGTDTMSEFVAAGGRLHSRVFLTPGYEPKSSPGFWQGALELNAQGGWWNPQAAEGWRKRTRPAASTPDAPPAPRPEPEPRPVLRSVPRNPCWEETAPIADPAVPLFATVTLAPLADAPANDRGPWHRPEVEQRDGLTIVVHSLYEPWNRHWPCRLYAPLPLNCGGGLNRVFPSQDAADAGLAAFVREVRAILLRSAEKEAA
ncbi:hypothetical protein ACLBYG_22240 [Methylobacterium sp. D53M]